MAGLLEITKQDPWFSPKARKFLSDLIARGEICDIDVGNEQAEEILRETKRLSLYNAKLLLRRYREYSCHAICPSGLCCPGGLFYSQRC